MLRALVLSAVPSAAGASAARVAPEPGKAVGSLTVDGITTTLSHAVYTTKPNGMGMGLAICRSIIEAHEGKLWASANESLGAVFQFTLPLERDESVSAAHADPKRAA